MITIKISKGKTIKTYRFKDAVVKVEIPLKNKKGEPKNLEIDLFKFLGVEDLNQ